MKNHLSVVSVFTSLVMLFAAATAVAAEKYERPTNRRVSDVLPAKMISGPHYRIRDPVVSYGYMHHFTVESDFGVFKVTGDGALRKLLKEIQAIAALRKIKESKAFADSIKHSATAPVRFGKHLITNPVDTITGLPKGVFRIFGNVTTAATEKHDPSEDSQIKQALFVSSWKRDYAHEMGVDVYSSNAVLQKELNSVGWAAAIGGLTVSAATLPASGTAGLVLKQMRTADSVNDALKEEPPARLRLINEKKLSAMGTSKDLIKRYLDHPAFTPHHDTILVAALARLKYVRGRDAFLESALSAQDEVAATFYMNIAQTIRGYHETVSPIRQISTMAGLTLALAKNGWVLIPFPLDHGVWTERADRIISHLRANYRAPGFTGIFELWVTGTLSPLARQQFELRGIKVVENADKRIEIID